MAGSRSVCIVLPTGSGKTRIASEIARRVLERRKRVLWLAHRAELVDQAISALSDLGISAGAVSASASSAPQPFADVQVATIQTLLSRKTRPDANLIVFDEAHHAPSDTFSELVRSYPQTYLLGPTATPERGDGRGLGGLFQSIIVGARIGELIEQDFLVPATLIAPDHKLRTGEIAQRPVDAYLLHARGTKALVFSGSLLEAARHAQEFVAAGLRARFVSGTTPWSQRRAAFDDLRSGDLDAVVNVYVATEGFDMPEVDCIILARGCGTAGLYLQMIGRALRPAPKKNHAVVLDLTGASHVHGHPEDDREYSLGGRGIRRAEETVDQSYCRVCGAPISQGDTCAECGAEPREAKNWRITKDPLVPYQRKRTEGIPQRVATLRRWLAIAREKNYKIGWVQHKFKVVYGLWPSREMMQQASMQERVAS